MSDKTYGRKYPFTWDTLGDIALGRPTLGPLTRLEVYRLMLFAFRDVLERHFGTDMTEAISYEAGKLAGVHFYRHLFGQVKDFQEFVQRLQATLLDMKIGILEIEEADLEAGRFVLTVSEDLDCSGLPELDYEACVYDEGFIAGLMESFTGKRFTVKEIHCWCKGDRTCRFTAEAVAE